MNAGYLLTSRWNSRRATVAARAVALISLGMAMQSIFIGLILLPRSHPMNWQEARGWLLAGIIALVGTLFFAALILSRLRRRPR
ncbi:MAG: hypothetical protein OXC55_02820 [Chloroflexi bacterium]|nr:hypothetical protein [Chloroflexota bacterium]